MNKIDNLYKNEFSNIELEDEDSNKIYNNIVSKRSVHKYFINKLFVVLLFSIFIGFTGIVSANIIKDNLPKNWFYHTDDSIVVDHDGVIREVNQIDYDIINQDYVLNNCKSELYDKYIDDYFGLDNMINPCYKEYTYDVYEDDLKIKLVRSTFNKKDKLILKEVEKNNNRLSRIVLYSPNTTNIIPDKYNKYEPYEISSKDTKYDLTVIIKTPDYVKNELTDEEKLYFKANERLTLDYKEYNIKQINSKALVYRITPDGWRSPNYVIEYVYDNIFYTVSLDFRQTNNIDEEINAYLDSLYVEED